MTIFSAKIGKKNQEYSASDLETTWFLQKTEECTLVSIEFVRSVENRPPKYSRYSVNSVVTCQVRPE